MRWSRIRLEAAGPQRQRRSDRSPRFTIDLPLLSDGRVAMHEFVTNRHLAMVKREIRSGGEARGTVILKDKQCTCTWLEGQVTGVPDVRLLGATFELGATVALRPGSGPAQLYEVTRCDRLPAKPLSEPLNSDASDPV